ncbi:hypothetical protein WA026_010706 [Henosepilachna vigintioctopunctata]|uniref:Uncharacterized protein n=1 Tax=Henosepilachna vigintioctopunctata TaxID=420089 RepID=A0AAW1UWI3_9CUCU
MLTQNIKPSFIQVEVFFVIIVGIIRLILDSSFITFSSDLEKVWNIALDPYKFPPVKQLYLKYFITLFIMIRTFTLHVSIAMYVVMIWPAVFADTPRLLIPWITVATLRLCIDIMTTFVGLYISLSYGVMRFLWIEFLLVQILQHGPSYYIWLTIVRYHGHLIQLRELRVKKILEEKMYRIQSKRKIKQLLLSQKERVWSGMEIDRIPISESTVNSVIDRINLKTNDLTTGSLDTLLEIIEKHKEKKDIQNDASSSTNLPNGQTA